MKHLSRSILRTIIIGILVIILFVGIVIMYYNMVYNAKRDGIIKDGKMTANQSADEFDNYLSTNIDLIKITAYTLDGMLAEGKTDSEIQDYLVGQSTAVRNAVLENSTGLYGYINGRFFSGTNWIPPEGYDPTIRPWYTKPMANPGKLTVLEPYVDVQSGNTMIALGKTLSDGVSVISVDVSLDHIQKLTEEAVTEGGSDIEMILTGDGTVVTHSDINEVGKNYDSEKETFGGQLFSLLTGEHDSFFELDHEDKHYIAYCAEFQGDWHCISAHDATSVFESLTRILTITIIVVITIVIILGIMLAVSGRRRALAEQAMASNEAKSAFLSNMSHEIRTPINAMLGMNEMIIRECKDKDVLSYSENVKNAGNTLLGIVNDILDFSKIEAGRMEIIQANYEISSTLNDLVNMIGPRAKDKGLHLNIDFCNEIPRGLYGDEVRIKQIIMNILTNAVKYTEKGSVCFSVGYKRNAEDPSGIFLEVSVKDTGIGIKEEDMGKLFSEFERIEEKRNRNIEGTGLGMNITQRLLKMMGSKLNVSSVYGSGSEFSFSLEQKVTDWEPIGEYEVFSKETAQSRSVYKVRFHAPDVNILAVDDNPMNLLVFTGFLKQTHIKIDTAERGDEALKLTEEKKYDIIFLDHMMPDKDGIETLHDLKGRKENPNIKTPVVCLTANAISGARERYISEGFDDYLSKPIEYGKLEEVILKYLPGEKVEILPEGYSEEFGENSEKLPEDLNVIRDFKDIDMEAGIRNSGTIEAYLPLLEIFFRSMQEKYEELEKLYSEKDLKNYTIKVHALKSSARIIGATELGEEAQELENASKKGDVDYITEHHEAFLKKYMSFKEPLSRIFEKAEDTSKRPEADPKIMAAAYEELKAAADDMDCGRLDQVFEEMREYRIPENDDKFWKDLKKASDNFDYDEILRLLDQKQG